MMQTQLARKAADVLSFRTPALWRAVQAGCNGYYALRPAARRKIFERIHASNHWGDAESLSGGGSNLDETAALREALPGLFERHGIRTLLDIPCGDFHWMQHLTQHLDRYIGGDIVPALVQDVRSRHAGPGRDFLIFDLVTDDLPRADAVLCRDVFIHLSERDVKAALTRIKASGAEWLLTTTYPDHENQEIITGAWRPINLQAEPYNLPVPVELINERTQDKEFVDRSVGLWRVSVI